MKKILTTENEKALFEHFKASLPEVATTGELASLSDDAGHRTVSDAEKAAWNGKADVSALANYATKAELAQSATREELEATAGQIMASVDGKVDGVNLSAKNVMTVNGRYKGVNAHIFDPHFDRLGNKDKIIIVTRPQHVGADGNVVVDRTAWLNVFGFEGANANRAGLLRGDEWSFLQGLMNNGVVTRAELENIAPLKKTVWIGYDIFAGAGTAEGYRLSAHTGSLTQISLSLVELHAIVNEKVGVAASNYEWRILLEAPSKHYQPDEGATVVHRSQMPEDGGILKITYNCAVLGYLNIEEVGYCDFKIYSSWT